MPLVLYLSLENNKKLSTFRFHALNLINYQKVNAYIQIQQILMKVLVAMLI